MRLADAPAERRARYAGEHEVEDDQVEGHLFVERPTFLTTCGAMRLVAFARQLEEQRLKVGRLVFDDEYACHRSCSLSMLTAVPASGSATVKVEPSPGFDHTSIVPPLARMWWFAIDNPRPVPPVRRERAGSTR